MAFIEISDEQLRTAGAEAFLANMTPEQKEGLVKGAIEHLLAPEFSPARWSTMQNIFNYALRDAAQKLCEEELAKPERRAQLSSLVLTAVDKVFADQDAVKKTAEVLAKHLGEAMFGKNY